MMKTQSVSIPPRPSALMSSLRGLGYSPETALADMIDNCITAGAANIEIDLRWDRELPVVAILDDGKGMGEQTLVDAMCLGGEGPESARAPGDLGRFGMGMKTASLSQSRRLTVLTRLPGSAVHGLCLDVAVIARDGWVAEIPDPRPEHAFVTKLTKLRSGTLVLWEQLDELSGLTGLSKEAFYLRLEEIRSHLGMIFHRYIDGDASRIAIVLNGRAIKAWDPFQSDHPATQAMPSQRIRHAETSFTIQPYVLPHRDRFENETAYDAAGGPGGWGARQGFYVYRGKRLLVSGSWLGLGSSRTWTRDESSRLARIQIDLPTNMDREWRIDVRKSQARPPGVLRTRLTDIAARCRGAAREVFAFRGQGPRVRGARGEAHAVWLASASPRGIQYRINRDHPVISACRAAVGSQRPLDAVLSIIERSMPVERIWLDVSESEGAAVPELDTYEVVELSSQLVELGRMLPPSMSTDQRVETLLRNLPGDLTALRATLKQKIEETDG
ncbi:histidine kinase/DNA gyrase B/HSP90-like ATPase [Phyllobacterium myrsinacearum]|uniref:ATP-binding protein n=1 Tax=Phyllobacterium myrsinacearum TaxID=28101 RepID=UPI0010E814F2|nr:ATP-binding protein [Phyllobacterium myrsinacearum]RZS76897.1 histidine kinase/DNA gyrase B/HSP90-like ATPase [Phyllobacterium myrsinacearum]